MATPPTTVIFRRNREAIKARIAAKKAEDEAYRQQFIDAAAADAAKAAQPVPTQRAQPAPQPQAAKQQQHNQRR
jgi:hypothetical protein